MDRYERLANAAKDRREKLGMTQERVNRGGGPSYATLRRIESGKGDWHPRPGTLLDLDRGLLWPPGTASDVFYGKTEPIDAIDMAAISAGDYANNTDLVDVTMPANVAALLRACAERRGVSVGVFLEQLLSPLD